MGHELVTRSGGYQAQRPTSPRRVAARERDLQAIELRKAGYTYREIGAYLGISHVAAGKAIKRGLDAINDATSKEAEDLRQLELERLDAINRAMWPKMLGGDVQAAAVLIRTIQQRSRLLGLEAPRPLVTIDQRQVTFDRPELPEYTPMEPEKFALARALMEIEPTKRQALMAGVDAGEDPREVLAALVADVEASDAP